ncbi:MAG: uL13 family ribosomal protein [Patescibacteria group bacterium]|nr:uL13 family ribosomal protein [Patescibacteria group bacterium]
MPKTSATIKKYVLDAKGKKLGRLASEAASLLMGKNSVTFTRHKAPDVTVEITNASKLLISEKHRTGIAYARFSGYQGGLKFETLEALSKRRGYKGVVIHAVRGMIPKNKLRPGMLKRLIVKE